MRTKTNNEDFAEFKKWARFFIEKFGLTDFELYFFHKDFSDDEELVDSVAAVMVQFPERLANIYFNKDWTNEEINEIRIKKAALHEVLHILLSEYWYYACSRFETGKDTMSSVEHSVIRRLENFLMGE